MPLLEWNTKSDSQQTAKSTVFRLLEEVPEHSYGDPASLNMIIQGDNLEALKALIPFYASQVTCIFIDPPYNTKSAFEHYDDNLEHSIWLTTLYPRIELLRELLSEKGSIWVTIDDNEVHYLKVLMDEVFGRKNFVANCIWEKKYSPQNDAKWMSDSHDHILVYARKKEIWRPNLLPRTIEMNARYKNPDNDPRGVWKSSDFSVKTYSASNDYEIILPTGRVINPPESRCWVSSKERYLELVEENRIYFGKDGNNVPSIKRFLFEVQDGSVSKTIWNRTEVGDNQDAKREIKQINSEDVFTTPKPERLIERVLLLGSKPGDLVLDSFLGSGTTAAVAHKMGRRYIGIEMGDHAVTHCALRLKKVIEGEQGGISKSANWKGGGGFRFYKLGEPIFEASGAIHPNVRFKTLAAHIWFTETGFPWQAGASSPLLGLHEETAYYLLFNGILGDKRPAGGNVLTSAVFAQLPKHDGPKVIYGEATRLSLEKLNQLGIRFRQIPYDVKAR